MQMTFSVQRKYGNLYSFRALRTERECLEYLEDVNAPVLTTVQCETCEGKLSLHEIYAALESMPSNISPANYGLSKKLYLRFFDTISSILMESLNYSFEKG